MPDTPITALADLLDQRARTVRAIESAAEAIVQVNKDQAGYVAKMREKAELLATLAEDAAPLVDALPAEHTALALKRLKHFSASARMSLRVASPFFMSALLYPEDAKPGEPNDLENFAAEVRSWA